VEKGKRKWGDSGIILKCFIYCNKLMLMVYYLRELN
jgi:hypothetical protein